MLPDRSPDAAFLLSGVTDAMGYTHTSLTTTYPTPFTNPTDGWCDSIDYCGITPANLVRVQGLFETGTSCAYSTDGGVTWDETTATPSGVGNGGRVAISSTSPGTFVWMSGYATGSPAAYHYFTTTNSGASWTTDTVVTGIVTPEFGSQTIVPLASDKVNGYFYAVANLGGTPNKFQFYRSADGVTWTMTSSINRSNTSPTVEEYKIEAVPGSASELYLFIVSSELYHSTDGTSTWTKVTTAEGLFGLGKPAPGYTNPVVFVMGTATIGGVQKTGVFRSDDSCATWNQVSIASQPLGANPVVIEGDQQNFGRVFVGTSGRGIYYGQPQ